MKQLHCEIRFPLFQGTIYVPLLDIYIPVFLLLLQRLSRSQVRLAHRDRFHHIVLSKAVVGEI